MKRIGLGIDLGGTSAKLILADESGRTLARSAVPTTGGARAFLRELSRAAAAMERSHRRADAVCLAAAGDVDCEAGLLRRSPNIPWLEKYPLREALAKALGRPAAMHNDANMAAWGAYAYELKRKKPTVVCLTLGTGVGGGLVLNGKLWTGATGSAAEIGHMRVAVEGAPCRCGGLGCLEAYAGTYGIARTALEAAAEMLGPDKLAKYRGVTPKALAEAARRGDAVAKEAWARAGKALAAGAVSLVYLVNPDAVVFAGGVAQAGELLLGPVRRAFKRESFRAPFDRASLVLSKTPDLGGLGAALYGLDGG